MANLIDKLLFSIGLDPKDFLEGKKKVDEATKDTEKKTSDSTKKTEKESLSANKKVSEESVKQQKEIALRTKQSAEAYSKVRGEVLSLATAFMATAGIKGFISGANSADQSIGQFSKNIGVSTEKLSAWYGVVERFGGTAEDIASAFRLTQKIVEEIKQTGNSAALQQLGFTDIDLSKFANSATTAEERMAMLADSFERMNAQGKRSQALYIGGQVGLSESTMNVLLLGSKRLDELIARQEKLNATTAIDVENASKRINLWADLSARITRLQKDVLNDVNPAFEKLGALIDSALQFASKNLLGVEITLGAIAAITFAAPIYGIFKLINAARILLGLGSIAAGAGAGATVAATAAAGVAAASASSKAIAAARAASAGAGANAIISAAPIAANTAASSIGTGGAVALGGIASIPFIGAYIASKFASESEMGKKSAQKVKIQELQRIEDQIKSYEGMKDDFRIKNLKIQRERILGDIEKINQKSIKTVQKIEPFPLPEGVVGNIYKNPSLDKEFKKSPLPEGFFGPEFFGTSSKQASSYAESLASSQRRFNTNQNTQSNQITVGEIKVYSNNSDPAKVASEIPLAIKNYDFAAQGQFGAQ